jgi:hypothetical protein
MTRRARTSHEAERRLAEFEEQSRNPEGWRARLDLPPDATRADAWRAFLRGEGDDETWKAYLAAGRSDA